MEVEQYLQRMNHAKRKKIKQDLSDLGLFRGRKDHLMTGSLKMIREGAADVTITNECNPHVSRL